MTSEEKVRRTNNLESRTDDGRILVRTIPNLLVTTVRIIDYLDKVDVRVHKRV